MYKVTIEETQPVKLVNIEKYYAVTQSSYNITAYETQKKTGLAILTKFEESCYGFAYHQDIVLRRDRAAKSKYTSETKLDCIRKAIESGRRVLVFEDFKEFAKHAGKLSKL